MHHPVDDGGGGHVERAHRYQIDAPIHVRQGAEGEWRRATLRNISVSGLLFEPTFPLADDQPLEIAFALPPPAIGTLSCRAQIVRVDPTTSAVGARITDYMLGRVGHGQFVPPETEDLLWQLTREGSVADAIVVRDELEWELQYRIDGKSYYTHRYTFEEQAQMLADSDAIRHHLEGQGWTEEDEETDEGEPN